MVVIDWVKTNRWWSVLIAAVVVLVIGVFVWRPAWLGFARDGASTTASGGSATGGEAGSSATAGSTLGATGGNTAVVQQQTNQQVQDATNTVAKTVEKNGGSNDVVEAIRQLGTTLGSHIETLKIDLEQEIAKAQTLAETNQNTISMLRNDLAVTNSRLDKIENSSSVPALNPVSSAAPQSSAETKTQATVTTSPAPSSEEQLVSLGKSYWYSGATNSVFRLENGKRCGVSVYEGVYVQRASGRRQYWNGSCLVDDDPLASLRSRAVKGHCDHGYTYGHCRQQGCSFFGAHGGGTVRGSGGVEIGVFDQGSLFRFRAGASGGAQGHGGTNVGN